MDPNNWIHEYFNNFQNSSSSSNPPTPSSVNSFNSQIPTHPNIQIPNPFFNCTPENFNFVEAPDILLEKTRENDDQEDGGSVEKQTHLRNEALNDAYESIFQAILRYRNEAVGNSGGILCVWDPNMFYKMNKMVLDYFTMVRGEVVTIEDFNEVLDNSERFGSMFNKQGVEAFNSFISNACLVEVPLEKIQKWSRLNKESSNSRKRNPNAELADLDLVIEKGEGADVDVKRRHEVVSLLQEVEKVDSMEVAQKAKIKWAIEGDENSKNYHGVLNKKRGRLAIHGVLVDGILMESPSLGGVGLWDCGIDKAPGPDGFTFAFYRRYWNLIESDVSMLSNGSFSKGRFRKEIKKQAMIFKVDFEKAYDSVRWDFVDDILKKFRFGEKWCKWIQSCLHSSRSSVIINGSHTKEFQFHNGLKQGDPLSFFLFILVMKSLHILFQRVVDAGQWNQSNIDTITCVLKVFHRASGLRINMNKRSKVGGLMSRIQSWNDNIESMVSRLSRWKLKTLSIGGRLSLLKSVLGAILVYHMSIFKVHMKQGIDLPSFITPKLGNGVTTSFWDVAFKVLVPRLYALETMKNIDVASKLSHGGLEFSFRRNPRGGVEQAQLELLKEKVKGCILSNMNDKSNWSLEGSCEFSVSSVRKVIDATLLPKGTTKTRWIEAVLIKINVHAWKVKHDCLPNRTNISRRGMEIESMLCPICDNAVESSRHLFFSCHFISEPMHKITRWWDMDYMEINSFENGWNGFCLFGCR
nr:RNA-directed DNA polymerase, eukaryota, reverse transcriptase zinc-binding domain protein [Tanacetum cinerariifolium]